MDSVWCPLLATCGVVMCFHHIQAKSEDFRCLWDQLKLFTVRSRTKKVPQSKQKLEEEMDSVRVVHYECVQTPFLHINWLAMLGEFVVAARERTPIHCLWVVSVTICYLCQMSVSRASITPEGTRRLCLVLQLLVIIGNMSTALGPWDKYICLHAAHLTFHLNLSVVMADVSTSIPLSLCFCASTIASYAAVHGVSSISNEFLMLQFFQLCCFMFVPGLIEATARKRIDLAMQSKVANVMVSGFRRVIKGLCDGDLLLDSHFRVRGTATCLQRMLGTNTDFSGTSLVDLMVEESKKAFIDFMEASSNSCEEDSPAPRCLRVAFKGGRDTGPVSVDLFHVAIPDLHVPGAKHHIMALAEDQRPLPEAVIQEAVPSIKCPVEGEGDRGSVTSEAMQTFEELVEMDLFLDPYQKDDNYLDDILEAQFKFRRQTQAPRISRGMPTLKRFVHPSDWGTVEAYLEQVVSRIRTSVSPAGSGGDPKCPALDLGPLLLRLPGETKAYLYARSVKVSSGASWSDDVTTRLKVQLHISQFWGGE